MTTLTKTCLAVSTAGLAAGSIIDFGGFKVISALTVVLPLGAVFFGMFLISFMMEKEMAKFDEETAEKLQMIERDHVTPAPARKDKLNLSKPKLFSKLSLRLSHDN
jgi:hypothetical protein